MFSVFSRYPTSLVFLSIVLAAALCIALTIPWIKLLRRDNIGQQVRDDGPETHFAKQGTPTMGGVIILLSATLTIFLLSPMSPDLVLMLGATLLTGLLGFIDDFSKVRYANTQGVSPRAKLVVQFIIAIAFCLLAVNWLGIPPTVKFPFLPELDLGILTTTVGGFDIPWLYVIFVSVLLAGMSNAVNLTDGLDGLAAGTVTVVLIVMGMVAYQLDMLDSAIFAGALAGACIGFLWFNAHPADIFMGDTGSLALGTAIGCLAVVTKTELVSLVIGGLFVVEALSVMIQVFHYKRTHERVFLMAPLHHHFEKKGWSEIKVVLRFWIISGVCARILSVYPAMTPAETRQCLFGMATDILEPGFDLRSGWGIVDADCMIPYPYWDVTVGSWSYPAVCQVTENGIMNGTETGRFSPDGIMTRAMFAAVLHRIAGEPEVTGENPFTDVDDDAWYTDAVVWAAGEKIIEGCGNGVFGTDDPVTREQMVTLFWRYNGRPTAESADLSGLNDADQISNWAKDAFAWAVSVGVINGKGNGILDPKGTATRAEVAQIVMNYNMKII